MKKLDSKRVFVQYRDAFEPYKPIMNRKYTITHSDTSGELFVFIGGNYALDQITDMRDEVRIAWEKKGNDIILHGYVVIDGDGIKGNPEIRNKIFYGEMPIALQALRQADRFLFDKYPKLNRAEVIIEFISNSPMYNKVYNFGEIGQYV